VLSFLKKEFTIEEITGNPWANRAKDAELPLELFFSVAEHLDRRKIIGRFSTFLEHVKPSTGGIRVTRFNGLFHWAVPSGMENPGRIRSRSARDLDPLLLARGRTRIRQREY